MRKKLSRVVKLIIATTGLLLFFYGCIAPQKAEFRSGIIFQEEVDKCGTREKKLLKQITAQEQRHVKETSILQTNISALKLLISTKSELIQRYTERLLTCSEINEDLLEQWRCQIKPHIRSVKWNLSDNNIEKVMQGERNRTRSMDENEVTPWESFTLEYIYHVEDKLRPFPLEPLTKEYRDVINFTLSHLNKEYRNTNDVNKAKKGLLRVEGFSHFDRNEGILYDLYIQDAHGNHSVTREMRIVRPFEPVLTSKSSLVEGANKWVNIILPLKGKLAEFKTFLTMFRLCCMQDSQIFLTVVYFGETGSTQTKNILSTVANYAKFHNYELLLLKENFSREQGIKYAAGHWKKGNVVMLFCDVDIVFKDYFIERCRMNSHPGKRVYFPVVFSLYNPKLVYADPRMVYHIHHQLNASPRTGFWRTLGYGIVCQYRDDFLKVSQMRLIGDNWGREGVELYKGYNCLGLETTRAFDRGLFHLYQERFCKDEMESAQYKECLETKATYEMSHRQVGLLVFNSKGSSKNETA